MLDDETRTALVEEVLDAALEELSESNKRHGVVITRFTEEDDGHGPCIVFGGQLKRGYGWFEHYYQPHEAIEQIVRECEKRLAEATVTAHLRDSGEVVTVHITDRIPDPAPVIFQMAWYATNALLVGIRTNIAEAYRDSVDECLEITEAALESRVAGVFEHYHIGENELAVDVVQTIERLVSDSGMRKRKRLRALFASLPHIKAAPARGRSRQITLRKVRVKITECRKEGKEPAPKTVADKLDVTVAGLRKWAIAQGYASAEHAISALSAPETNSEPN